MTINSESISDHKEQEQTSYDTTPGASAAGPQDTLKTSETFGIWSILCVFLAFVFTSSSFWSSAPILGLLPLLFLIAAIVLGVLGLKKTKQEAAAGANNKAARILSIIGISLAGLSFILPVLFAFFFLLS